MTPSSNYTSQHIPLRGIFDHFFGHCGTIQGIKGPAWTTIDPQMDSKRDPGA